jgi:hypothetical protein
MTPKKKKAHEVNWILTANADGKWQSSSSKLQTTLKNNFMLPFYKKNVLKKVKIETFKSRKFKTNFF